MKVFTHFIRKEKSAEEINVNEICSADFFSGIITEEEIYPILPNGLDTI